MKIVTELDYEILACIPVYPEEKTRGDIVREIKQKYPDGRYDTLSTTVFDSSLLKFTKMFMLVEDKAVPDSILFIDMFDDADCLQSTLEPIDLPWVKEHIGKAIDIGDSDEIFRSIMGYTKIRTRHGWYKQSSFSI